MDSESISLNILLELCKRVWARIRKCTGSEKTNGTWLQLVEVVPFQLSCESLISDCGVRGKVADICGLFIESGFQMREDIGF